MDAQPLSQKKQLVIKKRNDLIIIVGHRYPSQGNGMWMVDLCDDIPTKSLLLTCNAIILANTTKII